MVGSDLFTHIRYMAYTTVPSITITLIIFLIIGLTQDSSGTTASTQEILEAINGSFFISPVLFIVPIVVVIMIIRKIPAIPAIMIGAILGGVFAAIFSQKWF